MEGEKKEGLSIMSGDFISDMLDKLSKKTGREWTLADIMLLAEKLPAKGSKDIDTVLNQLARLGLEVSEETKRKVKQKLKDGQTISLDELGATDPKQVKGSGKQSIVHVSGKKKKRLSLLDQLKKLSGGKKKKR
jgi:hypothetical protein